SSVVIALKDEDDAKTLIEMGTLTAYSSFCNVKKHSDKPPTQQCNKCWGFGHSRPQCKGDAKCRLCGEPHEEKDHSVRANAEPIGDDSEMADAGTQIKCAQCGGD
ncbi:hypothetical protein R3P38DRAFT_2413894, partial [Favolaschia claudopus]